jgi:hypothetical protein
MQRTVLIAEVPFVPLNHHDGRMVRGGGVFVFARRTGEARVILHMELASAIKTGPGHPRWEWALCNELNELLVCLASAPLKIGEADDIVWHEDAEFWPVDAETLASEESQSSREPAPDQPEMPPARTARA